jgi:hypothetical protein
MTQIETLLLIRNFFSPRNMLEISHWHPLARSLYEEVFKDLIFTNLVITPSIKLKMDEIEYIRIAG